MKRLIALILLFVCCVVRAANPAFGDFNTNQFSTNLNKVAIKSGARLTNGLAFGTWTFDGPANFNDTLVGVNIASTSFMSSFFLNANDAVFTNSFRVITNAGAGKIMVSDATGFGTWQSGLPSSGGTGTVNTLPKWTATNALGDSLWTDDGTDATYNGTRIVTAPGGDTTVVNIGATALDSNTGTVGGGIFLGSGVAVNNTSNLTDAVLIGRSAGEANTGRIDSGVLVGVQAGKNNTGRLTGAFGLGGAALAFNIGDASSAIMIGNAAGQQSTTNIFNSIGIGDEALADNRAIATDDIFIGLNAGKSSRSNMTFTVGIGEEALSSNTGVIDDSVFIGQGAGSGNVANLSDAIVIGNVGTGQSLAGTLSHIALLGTGATATGNNQWVAGDANYIYQFPGVEATFGGFVALSGTTNQYTDDGSTLLRNGVPISGSGSGLSTDVITLTYTGGTNILGMDCQTNAQSFILTVTNNAFFGTATFSNLPTIGTNKFYTLGLRMNATGGYTVGFTNTIIWADGFAAVVKTNANAISYIYLHTDLFGTNRLVATPNLNLL